MKSRRRLKFKLFSPLRIKLLVLVLLAICPLFALMGYFVFKSEDIAYKEVEKSTVRVSSILNKAYDEKIEQIRASLIQLAANQDVTGLKYSRIIDQLTLIQKKISGTLNAGLILEDGTVFCSLIPSKKNVNLKHRDYFLKSIERNGFAAGGFQIGKLTRKPSVNFGYPVRNAENKLIGVVYLAFDLNWFNRLFELSKLPRDSSLMILDMNQTTLYRFPPGNGSMANPFKEKALQLRRKETGNIEKKLANKTSYIFGYTQLKLESNVPAFFIMVGIPKNIALSDIRNLAKMWWVCLFLVLLATFAATYFWSEIKIQSHIDHLINIVKGFGKGKLYLRLGPPYPSGELGDLARSFDEMASNIMQKQHHIQYSKEKLEKAMFDLKSAQQKLLEKEKLKALGEMASGIAHDFNNSLTTILGFSELLIEEYSGSPQEKDKLYQLKNIKTAAEDAAMVVRRLREFYKKGEVKTDFDLLDLNDLILEVVKMTAPRWRDQTMAKGISIQITDKLAPQVYINGIESEIREVLVNLLFNAVDAMENGGEIIVETKCTDEHIYLNIHDTGKGMSEKVRKHCLEPFFTSKGDRGTGLGLSSSVSIMKRHGGSLKIDSELGKGTSVRLKFPRVHRYIAGQNNELLPDQVSGLSVLVIEDEEPVRKVISEYLKKDGHFIVSVQSAYKAFEELKKHQFDLIISDSGMPKVDGFHFSEMVRRMKILTPIILLTGSAEYIKENEQIPQSVSMLLSKPVSLMKIRDSISRTLNKSHPFKAA